MAGKLQKIASELEVADILWLRERGLSLQSIANKYNVSRIAICKLIRNRLKKAGDVRRKRFYK